MNPTAPQPQSVSFADTVTAVKVSHATGQQFGWKNGLLVAGALGLVVLLGFVVFAQTTQNTAVQKTGETAYSAGAAAARAAADAEARQL